MKFHTNCRDWGQKFATVILVNTSKRIIPILKSQVRSQTNLSRALKWGIAHLFNQNIVGNMNESKGIDFLIFAFFAI